MKIKITGLYLNAERTYQLIGSERLLSASKLLDGYASRANILSQEGIARTFLKEQIEYWLHNNETPTLGELLSKKVVLHKGQLFTIYQDFYGKGLSKYIHYSEENLPKEAFAVVHNKIQVDSNKRIRIHYSPRNLISSTAWNRLSGRTRLFVFAYIESATNKEIIARPYIIGDLHTGLEDSSNDIWDSGNYGEVHPTQIDQFSSIRGIYEKEKSAPKLVRLKEVPEEKIKNAFAEIIHEGNIPKDWGGEKSDLFSSNISIDKRFMSTAFLFKGPSRFKPMAVVDLGKNGDQIDRLFSEPADLLVLQHCHKITTAVRNTMRAYASRVHDLRKFCIIDGYDTIRLFTAYNKCGFENV